MSFKRKGAASRRRLAGRVLASLFAFAACFAPSGVAGQTAARADEGRISVEFFPADDAAKTNPVVLSFSGKLYDNVPLPEAFESAPLAEDERFVAKVIATNKRGGLEELLQLWNPPERPEIRKLASEQQTFEANRKFYSTIGKSFLRAKIYYGSYVIFIVRHTDGGAGEIMKDYPLKKVGGEYLLTNTLSSDPVFQYLTTKYVSTLRGR